MPLETATYINQLDAANPLGSDAIAAGDDHIRLIKSAVKATFPNITGPVTKTQAQINNLATQDDLTAALSGLATGGTIKQIIKSTTTGSSVSTSFPILQATSHSATITPTSTSSKILVIVSSSAYTFGTGAIGVYTVYRGSTNLCGNGTNKFTIESGIGGGTNQFQGSIHMTFLDEPNSTSPLTYTVYQGCANGGSSEYNISLFATMLLVEIL